MRIGKNETIYHYGIAFNFAVLSCILVILILGIMISLEIPDFRIMVVLGIMVFSMASFLGGFGFFRLNQSKKEIRSKGLVLTDRKIEYLLIEEIDCHILAGRSTLTSTKHHLTAAYIDSTGNMKHLSLYKNNIFSKTLCVGREVASELEVKLIVRSGQSNFEVCESGKKNEKSLDDTDVRSKQDDSLGSFEKRQSQAVELIENTDSASAADENLLEVTTDGEGVCIKYKLKVALWEILVASIAPIALLFSMAFVLIVLFEKYEEAWIIIFSIVTLLLSCWLTFFGMRRCFKAKFGVICVNNDELSFSGVLSKMPPLRKSDLFDLSVQSEGLETHSLSLTSTSNVIYRFHCRREIVGAISNSLRLLLKR